MNNKIMNKERREWKRERERDKELDSNTVTIEVWPID